VAPEPALRILDLGGTTLADSILTRARPLLAARLVSALLTVAVPMVLARALVPAEYGTFKQAWLVAQTLALLLPLGMTQSLYYFVPRDPARRDRYVAQAVWFHLAMGALAAAAVVAAGPLLGERLQNPELARLAPWIAAITALQLAGAPLDVAWNAAGRIGAAALVRVATELGRGAAILAGAAIGGDVESVLKGIAAAHALRFLVGTAVLWRAHGLAGSGDALRRQLGYALPFGLAFVLIVPQQQLHHYAVAAAVTPAVFAVYSVGTFQLPVVDILYTPVSELLQIGLAQQEGARLPPRAGLALFHEAVLQLSFAFLPVAGLLAIAAPALVELVFSARYLDAVPIFRLGVLSILLAALPLDGVMRARAQNRFMIALSGAKLGGTAALVLAGLGAAGPFGALAGWLLAEALARAVMLGRAARLFGATLREILPVRALAIQAVASAAAMPAAAVALHAVPGPLVLRLAACCACFAAAYLLLSSALGALPAGWLDLLRARRPRPATAPSGPE
jgi:O-antigen/teichoic acid export membrane protein